MVVNIVNGVLGRPNAPTDLPHPSGRLPFLGDVLRLDTVRPIQREMAMADELGPIFEIMIGGGRLVIVAGTEAVGEVLDESRFAKAVARPIVKLRGIAGDGLFTAYSSEPNWALAHNVLAPAFTKQGMRRYHSVMLQCIGELVDHWLSTSAAGPVAIPEDMNKLTLEVIGRNGFGYSFDSFAEGNDPFVAAMTRALTYVSQASNDIPVARSRARESDASGDRFRSVRDGRCADVRTGPQAALAAEGGRRSSASVAVGSCVLP